MGQIYGKHYREGRSHDITLYVLHTGSQFRASCALNGPKPSRNSNKNGANCLSETVEPAQFKVREGPG
jgi:hypothetical protein